MIITIKIYFNKQASKHSASQEECLRKFGEKLMRVLKGRPIGASAADKVLEEDRNCSDPIGMCAQQMNPTLALPWSRWLSSCT